MTDTTVVPASPSPPGKGFRIEVYPPHDREVTRDRGWRWFDFLATTAAITLAPSVVTTFTGSLFGPVPMKAGVLLGLGASAYLLNFVLPRMLISVPEWAGYVTLDAWKGKNIPYGPGYHPTHWWETRNKAGNYPLGVITKDFDVWIPTKTAKIRATSVLEYQIDFPNITTFVGIAESTIDKGFTAFIESFLTARFANQTADEARTQVGVINDELATSFMGDDGSPKEEVSKFEKGNALRVVSLIVKNFELPEAVQKTRDAIDEGTRIFEVIAASLGITPEVLKEKLDKDQITKQQFQEYRREALAISENATLELKRVDGDLGPAVVEALTGRKS